MKNLPPVVPDRSMKGEHTTHHQKGYWNGLCSDMFIETTFMRYGNGPGGLIGITLKPKSVSLHTCTTMLHDLNKMRDHHKSSPDEQKHKEEMPARIKKDNSDRLKIKRKIEECISPLDTIKHPPELINISSGKINSDKSVNAEDAALIGEKEIQTFTKNLPESLHLSLTTEENVKPGT